MLRRCTVRLVLDKMPKIPLPGLNSSPTSMSERSQRETATRHRDLVAEQARSRFKVEKDTSPTPERFIGIDLGTTNSCVAYIDLVTKRPKIIPSPSGSWVFPTSITFEHAHEKRSFGEYSRSNAHVSGEATVSSGKRLIGRRFGELEKVGEQMRKMNTISLSESGELSIEISGRLYSIVHITGMFLRYIKNEAEAFLKEPVGGVVVSVPAYFTPQQKVATEDAALIAGFDVLEVIDEPTAACLTYTLLSETEENSDSSYKIVFDLGGGTLDCALMLHNHQDHSFKLIATHGDALLGGNDWDQVLSRYFCDEFVKKWKIDVKADQALARMPVNNFDHRMLLLEAEKAKIHFTNSAEPYRGHHPAFYFSTKLREVLPLDTSLTLQKYLDLTEPLRERCTKCLDTLFSETTIKPSQVQQVLLVGGMTRDPPIRMLLQKYFGKKVTEESFCPPDYAVAIGAAVRGGMLKGIYPHLSDRTEFVAGTTQANTSGNILKRAISTIKTLRTVTPTALGVRWRGRVKGLSDEQIATYAKELVEYEMKQVRQKQLSDAEEAANIIMQRVASDSQKRHDHHDKVIKTLVEQLKFWQYMVMSFKDHEEHLIRTVGELTKALDELQGNAADAPLGPEGKIDFETASPTHSVNVYKSTDPYTAAVMDREVREKRMTPIIDPADDPTKVVVGGPKILRRKLPLPGTDNKEKSNILHSGHPEINVNVTETTREFFLKSHVERSAWQEPPPPEGEVDSWRAVKIALDDPTPVGKPVLVPREEMSLEEQMEWMLTHAAIDEPPSDEHRKKRDQAASLATIAIET
jgi:molecular chaperone DnaK (HSP70)